MIERRLARSNDRRERKKEAAGPFFYIPCGWRLNAQILIDLRRHFASLIDRAYDERLAAATVAGREDFGA